MFALEMVVSLLVILVAAEVFTNALEHLGERLSISEGVTGSVFAAVGTALPETLVPLLAVFAGTPHAELNQEIGVGAILGAPLMLSTLSLFLMGAAALATRPLQSEFSPEPTGLTRDLNFFLLAFGLSAVAMFVPHSLPSIRGAIAVSLLLIYFVYLLVTIRASSELVEQGHGTQAQRAMLFLKLRFPDHSATIILQLAVALALLVGGAKAFIYGVQGGAALLGVSPLLLSLLLVPVATELPEKINSILWIRRRKDTLAFGNITGAMVFQGTLLPAIGIMLTPWEPRREVLLGVVITLVAAAWLRIALLRGRVRVWQLSLNGVLYILYLAGTLH